MSEIEIIAMRGWIDIFLVAWLLKRFLVYAPDINLRQRFAQITIVSLLLLLLQWLGLWSWQEVLAALKTMLVIWPVLLVLLYLIYQNYLLQNIVEKAEFEVDWRKEYQEVLLQELEAQGKEIPPAPVTAEKSTDSVL
ncbi:MAG: hypothetical protein IPK14_10855 [Blastocatellia bacterium]|nr:hypothetical protein [Blastocatellia bacterium]MBN8724080.1 hypothetical protein [Acidobacteriota bacterium]